MGLICWINRGQLFSLLIQKLYVQFKQCKSQALLLLEWDFRNVWCNSKEQKKQCSILACFSCYVYVHLCLEIKAQLLSPCPDVSLSEDLTKVLKSKLSLWENYMLHFFYGAKKIPLCSHVTQTILFYWEILWVHLCFLFLLLISSDQVS